jgi:hypothetical protein
METINILLVCFPKGCVLTILISSTGQKEKKQEKEYKKEKVN